MMDEDDRIRRAAMRRDRAMLRKTRLHIEENDLCPVAGESAVSLVDTLTRESWTESQRHWPTYSRSQIPVRFVPGRPT